MVLGVLGEFRGWLRVDLGDPAGAAQRFGDGDLDRAVTRAVAESFGRELRRAAGRVGGGDAVRRGRSGGTVSAGDGGISGGAGPAERAGALARRAGGGTGGAGAVDGGARGDDGGVDGAGGT